MNNHPKPKFKKRDTVFNMHEYGIVLDYEFTKNYPKSPIHFTEGWWYKVLIDDKYWVWMHEDDMILIDESFDTDINVGNKGDIC